MTALNTSLVYRLSDEFLLKEDGEEVLAFNPESLSVLQLNSSIAHVANLCDGSSTCEEVVVDFAATYALDLQDASHEVYRALKILIEHDLIRPNEH